MFNIHQKIIILIIALHFSLCKANEIYYALTKFETLVNVNDLSMKKTSDQSIANVISNQKLENETNTTDFPLLCSARLLVVVGNGKMKFYKINYYTEKTFYLCNMKHEMIDTGLYKLDNRTSESPKEYYVDNNNIKYRTTNNSLIIYGDIVTLNFNHAELDYLWGKTEE